MSEIQFLRQQEVLDLHERLIAEFGGDPGLRDKGALESSLAAAENRAHYENANLAICAATYAYHLTQAHAFIDGNKRIAAAATEIFLTLNGKRLNASNGQIVDWFLDIAAGCMTREEVEAAFASFLESEDRSSS